MSRRWFSNDVWFRPDHKDQVPTWERVHMDGVVFRDVGMAVWMNPVSEVVLVPVVIVV